MRTKINNPLVERRKEKMMPGEEEPKNPHILIVDDERNIRTAMRRILLQRWSFLTITEAEDGEVALEKVAANKFDLIITDLMMPQVNGYELILRVHSEIPVIMISGGSRHPGLFTNAENLSKEGRILLLSKPFSMEDLREAVCQKIPQLRQFSSPF